MCGGRLRCPHRIGHHRPYGSLHRVSIAKTAVHHHHVGVCRKARRRCTNPKENLSGTSTCGPVHTGDASGMICEPGSGSGNSLQDSRLSASQQGTTTTTSTGPEQSSAHGAGVGVGVGGSGGGGGSHSSGHWLLLVVSHGCVEVFDTLGLVSVETYGEEMVNFTKRYKCTLVNTELLDTMHCGYYCLLYAYHRSRGYSATEVMTIIKDSRHSVKSECLKTFSMLPH